MRLLLVTAAVALLPCGAQTRSFVKAGDAVEGSVTFAQPVTRPLLLAAGQFFFAQINGIRLSMQLHDPQGSAMGKPGRTAAALITQAGEYKLEIRTFAPTAQRFTVTALQWRDARPDDNVRIQAIAALTEGYREAETATLEGRQAAMQHYRKAREITKALGDKWLEARCVLGEANIHAALGTIDEALHSMNDAIELYQSLGDRGGEAFALNSAALLYASRSQHPKAFDYYGKALAYRRERGDRRGEAEILRNMAIAHSSAGNYQAAIDIYLDVVERFRAAGDRYAEAVTLVQMGEFYLTLGDYEKAMAHARQSLPLHRAHADKTAEVHTLTLIGQILAAQGNHVEALANLNSAIQLSHTSGLAWLHVSTQAIAATSEEALGRLPRARELYLEALGPMRAHRNREGSSRLMSQLGQLELKAGRTQEAARYLSDALEMSEGLSNGIPEALARFGLAQLARSRNDHPLARTQMERALAIVENIRTRVDNRNLRATLLATRGDWYQFYVDLLMEKNDVRAAFQGVERSRARSLLDLLLEHQGASGSNATPPFSEAMLDTNTAILEYHLGAKKSWLFVVTREGIAARQLPGEDVIAGEVREARKLLSQPGRATLGRFAQSAARLHRMCVEPAMDRIAGKQRLVIVADGALHYLPFEALLTNTPATLAFAELPYLLKRWTIGYAPSATSFAALPRNAVAVPGHDLVAFGDPRGDLPGAAREAREIARSFPASRALLVQGSAASRSAVTGSGDLSRSRRIHFAAHGLLREQPAAMSQILLANGTELSVADVLNLKWSADLVVLSGCETGLGPQLRGEGILGFTRAFLMAGARSVAVSLWQVKDESTVKLMTAFYQRLSRGETNSDSLRQAKLELIRTGIYAHPFYWAPFVMAGRL